MYKMDLVSVKITVLNLVSVWTNLKIEMGVKLHIKNLAMVLILLGQEIIGNKEKLHYMQMAV